MDRGRELLALTTEGRVRVLDDSIVSCEESECGSWYGERFMEEEREMERESGKGKVLIVF